MGSVRKRGNKWYYSVELPAVDGKRKRIERVGGKTKKEALAEMIRVEQEINSSGYYSPNAEISFEEFSKIWFEKKVASELSISTNETYRILLNTQILPVFGKLKLRNINTIHIQQFLDNKKEDGFSKSTIDVLKAIISSIFKYAINPMQIVHSNPAMNAHTPSFKTYTDKKNSLDKPEEKKILSPDECRKIFEAFTEDDEFYLPIQIAFHTGMRRGEICALLWDNVDLERRIIHVKYHLARKRDGSYVLAPPKSLTSIRDIYIGNTLLNILKKQKIKQLENKIKLGENYHNSNFVCVLKNGYPVLPKRIAVLQGKIRRMGIDFNFHMFRHTHATMLVESGANFKDIQTRLGHSDIKTTMNIYAKTTPEINKDTINRFENMISSL